MTLAASIVEVTYTGLHDPSCQHLEVTYLDPYNIKWSNSKQLADPIAEATYTHTLP